MNEEQRPSCYSSLGSLFGQSLCLLLLVEDSPGLLHQLLYCRFTFFLCLRNSSGGSLDCSVYSLLDFVQTEPIQVCQVLPLFKKRAESNWLDERCTEKYDSKGNE